MICGKVTFNRIKSKITYWRASIWSSWIFSILLVFKVIETTPKNLSYWISFFPFLWKIEHKSSIKIKVLCWFPHELLEKNHLIQHFSRKTLLKNIWKKLYFGITTIKFAFFFVFLDAFCGYRFSVASFNLFISSFVKNSNA